MQFQKALVLIMEELAISPYVLAQRMDSDYRWIVGITRNQDWKPKLDTILRICYALQFDVEKYLEFVEFGLGFCNTENYIYNYANEISNKWGDSIIAAKKQQILETKPCHIAKTFRTFRLESGLTQKELGCITSFSVNSISLRESMRYHNYPTVTTLQLYCSAFGISLATFMRRTFLFACRCQVKNAQDKDIIQICTEVHTKWT